jgi:hypothetical protein
MISICSMSHVASSLSTHAKLSLQIASIASSVRPNWRAFCRLGPVKTLEMPWTESTCTRLDQPTQCIGSKPTIGLLGCLFRVQPSAVAHSDLVTLYPCSKGPGQKLASCGQASTIALLPRQNQTWALMSVNERNECHRKLQRLRTCATSASRGAAATQSRSHYPLRGQPSPLPASTLVASREERRMEP